MDIAATEKQPTLRITVEPAGPGEVVMAVYGELDCATVDRLRAAFTELFNRGDIEAIGLDLRRLSLIDSTGVGTLVVAQRISAQVGVRLRLIAVSAIAARVLGVLGVEVTPGLPMAANDPAAMVGTN
jgi:anti-anti-sigma factor